MYENKFDETMDEVSTVHDLNWNDDSKVRLFARFLGEEADPLTFERFEKFLEAQADEELVGDEECEHPNAVESDPEPPATWYCPDCGTNFIMKDEEDDDS